MLTMYPAIFYEDKDGGYTVIFPDLNHLATEGDNFDEAMEMAVDCLASYIYSEEKDGNTLPPPTPLGKVDIHCEDGKEDFWKEYTNVFANTVAVDVDEYAKKNFEKSVRLSVSIPKWLRDKARARKVKYSEVFQKALMKELRK